MTTRLHVSIGPVQGFVAQSRRTRDLWGSSYLLSFLSAHAMHGAARAGCKVIQPVVDDDQLYRWVAAASGDRTDDPPQVGTLPNHFVVETEGDARQVADAGEQALKDAWKRVCDSVWARFVARACPVGDGTERIWNRQTTGFWEVTWVAGAPDAKGLLARRKHWRTHRLPDEPGDKCTVMPDLQELSGYVRAESRGSRERQDRFWKQVEHLGPLDMRDNERLCAIALVKRLFPKVAQEALGWEVDTSHWPSTVYVGALPWIRRTVSIAPEAARQYADGVRQHTRGEVLSERRPSFKGLDVAVAGKFSKLDANYFHRNWVKNDRLCPLTPNASGDPREQLVRFLEALYDTEDKDGKRLGPPPTFYALLLADGDRLGQLVARLDGRGVGRALMAYNKAVPKTVKEHDGLTVYAGGDDALALLPVPDALSCATALSQSYSTAFAGESGATLSAAVVFAHVRYPLNSVLATAHQLLDDVAKDGNGRNSLAAGVLKPGGLYCQWVTTWTRTVTDGEPAPAMDLLNSLVERLKSDASEPGLSSALIYRIREMLSSLCGWDRWEPGAWGRLPDALDLPAFLQAEILHSLSVRMGEAAETRAAGISDLVSKLLMRSKSTSEDGHADSDEVGIDAVLLARFLATSGHEEAD